MGRQNLGDWLSSLIFLNLALRSIADHSVKIRPEKYSLSKKKLKRNVKGAHVQFIEYLKERFPRNWPFDKGYDMCLWPHPSTQKEYMKMKQAASKPI